MHGVHLPKVFLGKHVALHSSTLSVANNNVDSSVQHVKLEATRPLAKELNEVPSFEPDTVDLWPTELGAGRQGRRLLNWISQ